jgi:uncharacterized small protein (DUF1192 family)
VRTELPTDWHKRLSNLPYKLSAKEISEILEVSENVVYMHRVTNQEFDNCVFNLSKSRSTKHVFRKERSSIQEDNVDTRSDTFPLIDRANLSLQMRMGVLQIVSITQYDLKNELNVKEVRRWGALMALAYDVIEEKNKEIRRLQSEINRLKTDLHNRTRGTLGANHQTGIG